MSDDYLEGGDSISPGSRTYRFDGATGSHPYYVLGDQETLRAVVRDLVGFNEEPSPLDMTIVRHLPRQHPKDPALWASQVLEVGQGRPEMELAASAEVEDLDRSVVEFTLSYPESKVTIGFEQKPYNVLPDNLISVENGVWVMPGIPGDRPDTRPVKFATEWIRFCRVQETWSPQIITAQLGQLIFARKDTTKKPHKTHVPGSPRIDYPEFTLEVTHYQVPSRWLWSRRSHYKTLANRVNQLPMDLENYHFEPGELLYVGYTYEDYWPPLTPAVDQTAHLVNEKWINVKLRFQVAYRQCNDPPDLPNGNWIANGHNCLPSIYDRQFYYICNFKSDPADIDNKDFWTPMFYSVPLQCLFSDPDVRQPDGLYLMPLGEP